MKSGDLIATLGVLLVVAILMIATARRARDRARAPRELVEAFLKTHPGPVELRPARATIVAPIVLTTPSADRVLELLGQKGGEMWSVGKDEGPTFIRVPGWGEGR